MALLGPELLTPMGVTEGGAGRWRRWSCIDEVESALQSLEEQVQSWPQSTLPWEALQIQARSEVWLEKRRPLGDWP